MLYLSVICSCESKNYLFSKSLSTKKLEFHHPIHHIQSNLRVETTRNTSGTLWKEPPRIWDVLHVPNHKEYPWINAKPWVFKANGGREVERHSIKEQLHLYQSSILASLSINTGDFRTTGWTYVTIGLEPFWYILAISVIAATNW